jgi:hypothetical protein
MMKMILGLMCIALMSLSACDAVAPAPADPTPSPYYWEQAPPQYPALDVTDLRPDAIDMTSDKVFPSLTYGIHTSFWINPDYRNIGIEHLKMLQFTHIRQKFAWRDIEPTLLAEDDPIRYFWHLADPMMDDLTRKGINVVARLDAPPDWAILPEGTYGIDDPPFDMRRLADYCRAVATRYKGRIVAYQVWNEPNLEREWGGHSPNPVAYVRVLRECGGAIRQADPQAIIISAGLAPTGTRNADVMPHDEFLWRMYAAGASPYFDVLGVHAAGYRSAPEDDPYHLPTGDLPWMSFRNVEAYRAIMVANGDAHKQIAVMEMGWTTDQVHPDYAWYAVTPEVQGDYLARAYLYAAQHWRPWVGLMVTLYYPNPDWTPDNEEWWWAIGETAPLPAGFTPRPAWWDLMLMDKISTNPDYAFDFPDATQTPVP